MNGSLQYSELFSAIAENGTVEVAPSTAQFLDPHLPTRFVNLRWFRTAKNCYELFLLIGWTAGELLRCLSKFGKPGKIPPNVQVNLYDFSIDSSETIREIPTMFIKIDHKNGNMC